jgi:hypothetical protein
MTPMGQDPFSDKFVEALSEHARRLGLSLHPDAELALRDEIAKRLYASPDPRELQMRWLANAPQYAARAADHLRIRRPDAARVLTPQDISSQFASCREVCPPPE